MHETQEAARERPTEERGLTQLRIGGHGTDQHMRHKGRYIPLACARKFGEDLDNVVQHCHRQTFLRHVCLRWGADAQSRV